MTFIIQTFHDGRWQDAIHSNDIEEAKHLLRQISLVDQPESAHKLVNRPDPVFADAQGRQLVQVEFEPNGRAYTYSWPRTWEPLAVGDVVHTPPNVVSPDGGVATVVQLGSGWAGNTAEIEGRAS